MRHFILPALLLLPGCMESVLWPDQRQVKRSISAERAHFVVEAVAADPTPVGTDSPWVSLVVRARHRRGRWVPQVADQLGTTAWFALQLPHDDADVLLRLLTEQPLGRTEHCAIDVHWTRSPDGYEFWEGRVELRGALSPALHAAEVNAQETAVLRQENLVLEAGDIPDLQVRECAELAAEVDPRLLFPFTSAGALTIVCLWPIPGAPDAVEPRLLATINAGPHARHLVLPPELAPLLTKVQRERDTFAAGFVFGCSGTTRPIPAIDLALAKVTCPATLMLRTRIEAMEPRLWAIERLVLQPIVRFVDATVQYVLETLFPELFPRELPANAPRAPGRR